MSLTIQQANVIIEKAVETARTDFQRPICVAICDRYGFLLAFSRMDEAPIRCIDIAQNKAYTAARMEVNTDTFLARLRREEIPAEFFCDAKLIGMPGGSVLKDKAGKVQGGVGISGLAPLEDQALAQRLAILLQKL